MARSQGQAIATRILAFTGTRADFGLLVPVLELLEANPHFELNLVVGGSHFSESYGHTVDEIVAAGFAVDWPIDLGEYDDTDGAIARAAASTMAAVSNVIDDAKPDIALVLGDRYEALAFASACLLHRVTLAHVHGGEITRGAVDDAIRNAITQMSSLHFVAAEPFAERVRAMGAPADHVFVVGAPGLDTVKSVMGDIADPRQVLATKIGSIEHAGPLFLVSFHPETRSDLDQGLVFDHIVEALIEFDDSVLVVTAPNADWSRNTIAEAATRARVRYPDRVRLVASFGHPAYVAAMMAADVVVGNSSSGIIEVPITGTPTVDIGDRQSGRPVEASVFRSGTGRDQIVAAVTAALDRGRTEPAHTTTYGDGQAGRRIVERLLEYCAS